MKHTEEHKAKIAASLKGHPRPQEVILKVSETKKRRSENSEWHINFSKAAKQRWQTPEYRSFMLKYLQSEERKMELSRLFKGRSYSDETRQKMSQGRKRYITEHPNYLIELQKMARKSRIYTRPTKAESQLINTIEKARLPFRYVGNGEVWLGNRNPDFINTNGKKQVIELFGTYWHAIFDVAQRTEHYKQYGFDCLVIWEDELNNPDKILKKIRRFVRILSRGRSGAG